MGDQDQFSDDISALWGPGKQDFEPRLPRCDGLRCDEPEEHGSALEREVRRLQELVIMLQRVGPDALRCELEVELGRQRSEATAATAAGLSGVEARIGERLDRLAEEVAELTASLANLTARATRTDADRALEIERLAAAIEAHEAEPVGKHRAWKLRHEIDGELDRRLSEQESQLRTAADSRVTEIEARMQEQVDRLLRQVDDLVNTLRGSPPPPPSPANGDRPVEMGGSPIV